VWRQGGGDRERESERERGDKGKGGQPVTVGQRRSSNAAIYSHDPRESYFYLCNRTAISVRGSKEGCAALGLTKNASDETRRKRMEPRPLGGTMGLEDRMVMLIAKVTNGNGAARYLKGAREVPFLRERRAHAFHLSFVPFFGIIT
jgi:hypothetical protein